MFIDHVAKIPSSYGNFDRIVEPFALDSANVQVAEWQSRKTGLSVVWADVDGPLVHGCLTLPIESFSESVVPHALEHLVFLGSENYPYPGVLDRLANRAMAKSTDAWTTATHTAYTVDTAGFDGFLRLLPVYFDHVLHPTLTPEAFKTEIYHLNRAGEEGGALFNKMRSREVTSEELKAVRDKRLLGGSTYNVIEKLRKLTPDQVKDYHKQYYHSHNLQLIVTGKVEPAALLEVLDKKIEPELIKRSKHKVPEAWNRQSPEITSKNKVSLLKSETEVVDFPMMDESTGEVQISWVGPPSNEFLHRSALDILGNYLSSPASPLWQKLSDPNGKPLCTEFHFSATDGNNVVLTAQLSSVRRDDLMTISEKFQKIIAEQAGQIDVERVKILIEREKLQAIQRMEDDPHTTLLPDITSNFLHGESKDLKTGLSGKLARFDELASWTEVEWANIYKRWLANRPTLTVIGRPSADLLNKMKQANKQRVKDVHDKYKTAGLEKLGLELEEAQKVVDKPYPEKLISGFEISTFKSIKWINVGVAQTGGILKSDLQVYLDRVDRATLPFFVQFNHIESKFLTIYVTMSPTDVKAELFELLPIYLQSFFSLPIKRKKRGTVEYDQVVEELDKMTFDYGIKLGSPTGQTIQIHMTIEKSKYADAVEWLQDLLWGSEFNVDRMRRTAEQFNQGIPLRKRDGVTVAAALYHGMIESAALSPRLSFNLFRQEASLPKIIESLKAKESGELIQTRMEQLRKSLLKGSCMRMSVTGDIKSLEKPQTTWLNHFEQLEPEKLEDPLMDNQVLSSDGKSPSGKGVVMMLPASESSTSNHSSKGPQGFGHPDDAPLHVALSILNAEEGFLWKATRGVANAVWIGPNFEKGLLFLHISRSPDLYAAFMEAQKVVNDLVDGKLKISETLLETGKNRLAHTIASQQANGVDAAYKMFSDMAFRGRKPDASKIFLEQAQDVTVDQVLRMMREYLVPIFDPLKSGVVVASSAEKHGEIVKALSEHGYSIEEKVVSGSVGGEGISEKLETGQGEVKSSKREEDLVSDDEEIENNEGN